MMDDAAREAERIVWEWWPNLDNPKPSQLVAEIALSIRVAEARIWRAASKKARNLGRRTKPFGDKRAWDEACETLAAALEAEAEKLEP